MTKNFSTDAVGLSKLAILMRLLLLVCVCNGCRNKTSTVSVIPRSTDPLLWATLEEGVKEAANGTGIASKWEASLDNDESQLRLLIAATDRADRGIIFTPDETRASRNSVLEAVGRHIPVVVIDDEFGPPPGPFLSYVLNDENVGAELAAERLAKQLHGHGTAVIVGINAQLESGVTREVLFESALSRLAPGIKVTLRQFGDAVITHQQQICQELLNSSTPPDAIVALSATATRGAFYAKIASENHPTTLIVGFDQDGILPLQTGDVDAVVAQDTRTIGRHAMENVLATLGGRSVSPRTLIAPILLTRENIGLPAVSSLLGASRGRLDTKGLPHEPSSDTTIQADLRIALLEAKKHEVQAGVQSIGSFIRVPGRHPNVTIQGTVISLPPMLGVQDMQDTNASLFITNFTTSEALKLGDVVAVHGDLISERFRCSMNDVSIRVLWAEKPIPPLAVTASQLTGSYRGESIEVEAEVLSENTSDSPPELILRDDGQTFNALVYSPVDVKIQHFATGSRVRLRGVAASRAELTSGIYPFTVVANKVEMVSAPPWWSPAHLVLMAILAAGVLLGVQWFAHSVQRWHLRTVLAEREQLAFEMHDTLAQSFTGIAFQLHAASVEQNNENAVQKHISHALEMVTMSRREAGRTIAALRPQHRDAPGILVALKQLAERLSAGGTLSVQTLLNDSSTRLPLEVADVFFRIGQEAISNAIQHGRCRQLVVALSVSRRKAIFKIQDDGLGFSTSDQSSGLGIIGMRKRAEKIGARFRLISEPAVGTSVIVSYRIIFAGGLLTNLRAKLVGNFKRSSAHKL